LVATQRRLRDLMVSSMHRQSMALFRHLFGEIEPAMVHSGLILRV
jgi:hypothetical protein